MAQITEECLSTSNEVQPQTNGTSLINFQFPQCVDPYDGGLVPPRDKIYVRSQKEILEIPARVYISGPISGVEGYMEKFGVIHEELKANGHFVINPASILSGMPDSTAWEDYMKLSFCMLDMCDVIYMLDNWEASRGAVLERKRAVKVKKKVVYHNPHIQVDVLRKTLAAVAGIRI